MIHAYLPKAIGLRLECAPVVLDTDASVGWKWYTGWEFISFLLRKSCPLAVPFVPRRRSDFLFRALLFKRLSCKTCRCILIACQFFFASWPCVLFGGCSRHMAMWAKQKEKAKPINKQKEGERRRSRIRRDINTSQNISKKSKTRQQHPCLCHFMWREKENN